MARRPGRIVSAFGICLALSLACPGAAGAAVFEELYTVSVAPDPEARNQRSDAIRRGMRVLLTRVTGLRSAPDDPRLAGLIADAERHNTYYGEVADDEIRIGFRRAPINEELTRLGLPIWADERPSTLLWAAMDFGAGERAEVGASRTGSNRAGPLEGDASNELRTEAESLFEDFSDEILTAADQRGLPIVLPRLDAEDRRFVRFADVWGGFDRFVEQAAERYGVDAILIARVSVTDAGPEVRWVLRRGEARQEFVTAEPRAGIERLADQFAAEYTIVGGTRRTRLTIRGIETWPDYGRVLEYLESLSIVESVDVQSLSPEGELRLSLVARGDDSQLSQVLTLGGVLARPVGNGPDFAAVAGAASELVFVPAWRVSAPPADAR